MSEGVHDDSPASFWSRRAHYIFNALVDSGALSLDKERYHEIRARLMTGGLSAPLAAQLAFAWVARPVPSACEVNPW